MPRIIYNHVPPNPPDPWQGAAFLAHDINKIILSMTRYGSTELIRGSIRKSDLPKHKRKHFTRALVWLAAHTALRFKLCKEHDTYYEISSLQVVS